MTNPLGGKGLAAGYMGNTLLKRPNVPIDWTNEQLSEYVKCKQNPQYFVENYMKIVNVDKGLLNFKMYPYQKKMLYNFYKNRYTICKLPRQSGKCVLLNTVVKWKHKPTGMIYELTGEQFYKWQAFKSAERNEAMLQLFPICKET